MDLSIETIQKYDVAAPRYTSYPTAPVWQENFDVGRYFGVLGKLEKPISVYVHIPFCESLCYYCGCNVTIRKNRREVGDEYLDNLSREIELVFGKMKSKPVIRQLHFGGGTPNFLSHDQLKRVMGLFRLEKEAEVSIEIDPRHADEKQLELLRELGFNRISMGIQDFSTEVQMAINRVQPFDLVEPIVRKIRDLGFHSLNLDLIYGLPKQTEENFKKTIGLVLALRPDRVALYSYAHVPWLKSHQKLMDPKTFPTNEEKMRLFLNSRKQFLEDGYLGIAMDHFALESDELASAFKSGTLHRNFMGYTLKPTDDFLGFGVSAIGFCGDHYIQNTRDLKTYYEALSQNTLPVSKGMALSQDDLARQWTINQLMCKFKVDKEEFEKRFAERFDRYFAVEHDPALVRENAKTLEATELGRLFIRNICMRFDAYLAKKEGVVEFSRTV